jgi:protein TonB
MRIANGIPGHGGRRRASAAAEILPAAMLPSDPQERGVKVIALCLALALHLLVLSLDLPSIRSATAGAASHRGPIVVKRYLPPPPKIEQPQRTMPKTLTRKIPLPDPTPDAPEPIREPDIEIESESFSSDLGEFLIGDPIPPPGHGPAGIGGQGTGPLLAGVGGVTQPVRIEEAYVRPEYPELGRAARIETTVVLQAVIYRDGTVGEIEILRCLQPAFGFEEAAIHAVQQWRYHPATQNGKPVCVYFTVVVEFSLV